MAKVMTNKIKRIYIEITNICNLTCSFCSTHHRENKMLSLDEFSSIIQDVKQYTKYIYLHVQGEPLTHPDFNKILYICDENEMQVQLVTNVTFLYKYLYIYLHPSLRKVSISLQSIEYQSVNLEDYMHTLITFIDYSATFKHPIVEVRFWRNDQYDLPKTKKCMDILNEKYTLSLTERNNHYRIKENIYVDFDNMFSWTDLENMPL